jgi:protein ImuB
MGFDPPAERLDVVLFAARHLAAELAERLEELVLACTLVAIEAETVDGGALVRRWRHEDGLTSTALAERVRWQVEAWLLRSNAGDEPTGGLPVAGGIIRLRLVPELIHPERGRQLAFWGARASDGRAARALTRVQGLLGADAVTTAVVDGGRTPAARVRLIPWGETRPGTDAAGSTGSASGSERPAWPGRIPPPAPATVYPDPPAVSVVDAAGSPVTVSDRGEASAAPARFGMRSPIVEVVAWAGPWPADERWWDPGAHRRRDRLQVLAADGVAHLVAFEDGRWLLEATYD